MKKIQLLLVTAIILLPLQPSLAADTLTNVEIIKFSDVTIRTSDMQPIPVLQPESVVEYTPGEELTVTVNVDNPAPRDVAFIATLDGVTDKEIEVSEGASAVSFTLDMSPEAIASIETGNAVVFLSGDQEELGFESSLTGKFSNEVTIPIALASDQERQELFKQIVQLRTLLDLLLQVQALKSQE